MIRLTWKLGEKSGALYVPENVIVMEHEGKTFVAQSLDDRLTGGIEVTETPEEVARKVLEWRLAMERYRAGVFAEAKETGEEAKMLVWARDVEYKIVLNLAGLEEPKNG